MLFFPTMNPDKSIMVSTKIWSRTTVFNIGNNKKCFLSSDIRMIYEGSRDTKDATLKKIYHGFIIVKL